jgi:hypothetical protein
MHSRTRTKFATREWWRQKRTHSEGEQKKDWKKLFKVRFNWHFGRCAVSEMDITPLSEDIKGPRLVRNVQAESRYLPPLVQFDGKIFITADNETGLRAWDIGSDRNGEQKLIGCRPFARYENGWYMGSPSTLAIDVSGGMTTDIAVGFDGGGVMILRLNTPIDYEEVEFPFERRFVLPPNIMENPAKIAHLAYSHPYLLTLDTSNTLRAYQLYNTSDGDFPRLLTTLHAQGLHGPCNLTLRREKGFPEGTIIAAIAYSMPLFHGGWSVGIQEVILDSSSFDGVAQTRIGTCIPSTYQLTMEDETPTYVNTSSIPRASPTSISYSHPYLLTSHLDNTLTLYLVRSRKEEISISQPQRLWGHTAAVARAGIGGRGRAVSVSEQGPELRVWELESLAAVASKADANERAVEIVESVRVENVAPLLKMMPRAPTSVEWIGFDEEKVLIVSSDHIRDKNVRLYDFTI